MYSIDRTSDYISPCSFIVSEYDKNTLLSIHRIIASMVRNPLLCHFRCQEGKLMILHLKLKPIPFVVHETGPSFR